jgi:NAD(P)-dependent dehydrogenase (short-subunit alcohol dehydrogenase family)
MNPPIGLITGFTSGIGKAAATALARSGMSLIGVSRSRERGEAAVEAIRSAGGAGSFHLLTADLASLAEIRALAGEVGSRFARLDLLINNAGGIHMMRRETVDGLEMTLAVNHLAPFLLTNLLLDRLRAAGRARVVTVASEAHRFGRPDWDDLQMRRRYQWGRAYAFSKLANILFTFELARRLAGSGVTANCLHPGGVDTELWREARGGMRAILAVARPFMISPEKGAEGVVHLAVAPELAGVSGAYFKRRRAARPSSLAGDPIAARRLWEASAALVGLDAGKSEREGVGSPGPATGGGVSIPGPAGRWAGPA